MSSILLRLLSLPAGIGRGERYWEWHAGLALIVPLISGVWLAAPFALWHTYGFAWLYLWLIPTAVVVMADALFRQPEGG